MTLTEIAGLYMGHEVLKSAYEYLREKTGCKAERIAAIDAMLIILDARVGIQEALVYLMRGNLNVD